MSTEPVDKSVGEMRIQAENPTILEKFTNWLKNGHPCKCLLLLYMLYYILILLGLSTESLPNLEKINVKWKTYFYLEYQVIILGT